ncbi:MAG: phenylacetate--CoA ligase family protein [Proteobacteria bacterium]|nr:phenylacetate--CoA ligase family protein [Pseudomonadota bacterium]MDA1354895.1 phenylacetate--CoA ligase family protein [Pseudomonadota bacterium]
MTRANEIPIPKSAMRGIEWPAIPDMTGNILLALLFQLEQSQWWSPERLRAAQFRQANSLLAHAFASVPYYSKRLTEAGYSPDTPLNDEAWLNLPLLKREDIQQAGNGLNSQALPQGHGKTHKISSSGSTGKPVELLGTGLTSIFWNLFTVRDFFWRRCDLSGKLAAIRPSKSGTANYPTGAMIPNWGPGFASAVPSGPSCFLNIRTPVAQQAEWLARQDADYLITFPSNLETLIHHCVEANIELPRLREVETLSERLPPGLRALCKEHWNIPLVDMYTAMETGYLALQCPEHSHYHIQSEHVILEILDADGRPCAAGKTGRIVVTDLHNFATPLIRYDIGDFGEAGAPCDCGRGLPVIKKIMGRHRNMITLPDGSQQWAIFPAREWGHIAPIRQLQMVQHAPDRIEAIAAMERPMRAEEQELFISTMQRNLNFPHRIDVKIVDEIPRGANGKFEDFISLIET